MAYGDDVNDETLEIDNDNEQDSLWYDYKMFGGDDLKPIIIVVYDFVVQAELLRIGRVRARKRKDQASFQLSIESLVANLSYGFVQWKEAKPLMISREKSPKNDTNIEALPVATFLKALDLLVACDFITENRGRYKGQTTTIEASASLLDLIQGADLTFQSFRRQPETHLVKLRRVTPTRKGKPSKREPIRLPLSAEVQAISDRVARLNSFLADANLAFVDDGLKPNVDTFDRRTMTRHFTVRGSQAIRFDQGGRLFGGTFWLNLPSERRGGLRIDGEPVADLDFKNLGPRIAYAIVGHEPPSGDLYDLTGLLAGYDNANPDHRKAIKRSFASCLNGGAGGSRSPNPNTRKPGILAPLPKGTSAAKVRAALLAKHPRLIPLFERDAMTEVPVGYEIMFKESCILLCALERLKDAGVVALPFHDGLMVAQSKAGIAKEALEVASFKVLGVALPVVSKPVLGAPMAPVRALAA